MKSFKLFSMAAVMLLLCCCTEDYGSAKIDVTNVMLNSTSLVLKEGESQQLVAMISPNDATNKLVLWSTSNSSVATVSTEGVVTAMRSGDAIITVRTDDGGKEATCEVKVKQEMVSVAEVTLNINECELDISELLVLSATVLPDNATDKSVSWSSSDENVATVDEDGNVTMVGPGACVITVKTEDGGHTAKCTLTVKSKVTAVNLSDSNISLNTGDTYVLCATVEPANATDKSMTWSSSDEKVATVSADGVITAIWAGDCLITASSANGIKAECSVTVTFTFTEPESVDLGLSVKWASFNLGATEPEGYGIYYAWGDVTGQTWNGSEWSGGGFDDYPEYMLDSNDNLALEYDAAHVILGGKWRIPTLDECAELIINCTSTWTNNYNGTGISGRIFTSNKNGNSIFLPAAGLGDSSGLNSAGSNGYYWSSTFLGGSFGDSAWNLCFISDSFSRYDCLSCRFFGTSVRPVCDEYMPVSSITLDKSEASLKVGESITLTATVGPEDATDKSVTWSSSDESVATVTNGTVKALKLGSAKITAKAGEKTAECIITVVATPVSSIILNKSEASLKVGESVTLTATVNPDDATDKSVTWLTSDASVAEVSENGIVKALQPGIATITAQAGGKTAKCIVTVPKERSEMEDPCEGEEWGW